MAGSSTTAVKSETSSQASLEERVARAKMLVQQRQAEREKEEEDKEKNQEIERRKLGQALLEQKRMKEEEEVRKAALERKKDKEEEKKAREAVKAAIEQDRLARKAKYDEEKAAADERRAEAERANLAAAAAAAHVSAAERASVARIQFRLHDYYRLSSSSETQFPGCLMGATRPSSSLQRLLSLSFTPLSRRSSQASPPSPCPRPSQGGSLTLRNQTRP